MKIAVVGGGGAGMSCAYYLAKKHEVVVFEKQPILGGNIRTLGQNVTAAGFDSSNALDSGVIEFVADRNQHLYSLLSELGVETRNIVGGSTSLYLPDGRCVSMPGVINRMPIQQRMVEQLRLYWVLRYAPLIINRIKRQPDTAKFGDALDDTVFSDWLRLLIMYGYSMPLETMDDFPIDLVQRSLGLMSLGQKWSRIVGGTYAYIKAIVEQTDIRTVLNCTDLLVTRSSDGFQLSALGQVERFDYIVLATPPAETCRLLSSIDYQHIALFEGSRNSTIETLVHTDTSIYAPYQERAYSEFDLFLKPDGSGGYNAYLNRLAGRDEREPHYFLAYNLEELIDPSKVVHRQSHQSTHFAAAGDKRREIRRVNGEHQVYFAGAYLYDGLHNGAVESACVVRDLIASGVR